MADLVKQRKDRELLKRAAARTANHQTGPAPPLLKQGSKRLKRANRTSRRWRRRGAGPRYHAQPNKEGRDSPTRA